MLSGESKSAVDALTKADLLLEINKGHQSRFQGDKFAYAQSRLKQLEDNENAKQLEAGLEVSTEGNEIAREANRLAFEANATARMAWRASLLSVVVAIVAIIVAMCTKN